MVMDHKNRSICCDVAGCKHNVDSCGCDLSEIKVTCGCKDCTCCGSYEDKESL